MQELSMHILDIAQNAIRAEATEVLVRVEESTSADTLTIIIADNGSGMSEEQVARVVDPFYTTRTTRNVGLGIPLFQLAAELSGGSLRIDSTIGKGTTVHANFVHSHVNRMPLGDMAETMSQLICLNEPVAFTYEHVVNGQAFTATTKSFQEVLDGIALNTPQVLQFVREYIKEHLSALADASPEDSSPAGDEINAS